MKSVLKKIEEKILSVFSVNFDLDPLDPESVLEQSRVNLFVYLASFMIIIPVIAGYIRYFILNDSIMFITYTHIIAALAGLTLISVKKKGHLEPYCTGLILFAWSVTFVKPFYIEPDFSYIFNLLFIGIATLLLK